MNNKNVVLHEILLAIAEKNKGGITAYPKPIDEDTEERLEEMGFRVSRKSMGSQEVYLIIW